MTTKLYKIFIVKLNSLVNNINVIVVYYYLHLAVNIYGFNFYSFKDPWGSPWILKSQRYDHLRVILSISVANQTALGQLCIILPPCAPSYCRLAHTSPVSLSLAPSVSITPSTPFFVKKVLCFNVTAKIVLLLHKLESVGPLLCQNHIET